VTDGRSVQEFPKRANQQEGDYDNVQPTCVLQGPLWDPDARDRFEAFVVAVAGVAIDTAAGEPGLIDVVRSTFRSWVDLLAEQLRATGVPPDRAAPIALATLAAMEGARILCRAEGHSGPLETVAADLMRSLPPEASATSKDLLA
jgi:hypothetical protein